MKVEQEYMVVIGWETILNIFIQYGYEKKN